MIFKILDGYCHRLISSLEQENHLKSLELIFDKPIDLKDECGRIFAKDKLFGAEKCAGEY